MNQIDQKHLRALQARLANPPKQINNNALYAGSSMYFYCALCGHLADMLPESYACVPKKHCEACLAVKAAHPGVSERTLLDLALHLPPVPP